MKPIVAIVLALVLLLPACKKESEEEFLTQGERNVKEIEKIIEESSIQTVTVMLVQYNGSNGAVTPTVWHTVENLANDYYFRGNFICIKENCYDLSNLLKVKIVSTNLEIHLKM